MNQTTSFKSIYQTLTKTSLKNKVKTECLIYRRKDDNDNDHWMDLKYLSQNC